MRITNAEHAAHPWVIGDVAPDFTLIDAWALPAQGGPDDFADLCEIFDGLDPADFGRVSGALFWVRDQLGRMLGWDDASRSLPVPGDAVTTLRARLPEDLRKSTTGLDSKSVMTSTIFTPLYRTSDEYADELSNGTVHAVLHLVWVEQGQGRYRGQMGVYVKPRGKVGSAYMTLIAPFRHLIVYPALMRRIARAWDRRPV